MYHHTPNESPPAPTTPPPTPTPNNAYNIPSVKALFSFIHTADGFPVESTWLVDIRAGNYATWPGLAYNNAKTYHPTTAETLKGPMTQTHQGVLSAKRNTTSYNPTRLVSPISSDISATTSNKLFVVVIPSVYYILMTWAGFPSAPALSTATLCSHSIAKVMPSLLNPFNPVMTATSLRSTAAS